MAVVGRHSISQGSRRRVVDGSRLLEGLWVGRRSWDASPVAAKSRASCTTMIVIRCYLI